jgi:hypothetical protein
MADWLNLQTLAVLGLAAAFGGMLFFSGLMAPLIFTQLPADIAGGFIRRVFPWYYLVIGGVSLLALLCMLAVIGPIAWETIALLIVVAGFVYARQWLMPRINQARDAVTAGNQSAHHRFDRLHRASVAINGLQLLIVTILLIRLIA